MRIFINFSTKIADVQKAFSTEFPYLKIEFFDHPDETGRLSSAKYMISERQERFAELPYFIPNDSPFEVDGGMTVAAFEQNFHQQFDLSIQVFRKSMGNWLAISTTDSWTLEEQNMKGEEAATAATEMVYIERTNDSELV